MIEGGEVWASRVNRGAVAVAGDRVRQDFEGDIAIELRIAGPGRPGPFRLRPVWPRSDRDRRSFRSRSWPWLGYGPPPLGTHPRRGSAWSRRSCVAAKADETSPQLAQQRTRDRRRASFTDLKGDFVHAEADAGGEWQTLQWIICADAIVVLEA